VVHIKERSVFIMDHGTLLNCPVIQQKHTKLVLGSSIKSQELSMLGTDSVDGDAIHMAATNPTCK